MKNMTFFASLFFLLAPIHLFGAEQSDSCSISEKEKGKEEEAETKEEKERKELELIETFISEFSKNESLRIYHELGKTSENYRHISVNTKFVVNKPSRKQMKYLRKKGFSSFSEHESKLLIASVFNHDYSLFHEILQKGLADPNVVLWIEVELTSKRSHREDNRILIRPYHALYYAVSNEDNKDATTFAEHLIEKGSFFFYASQLGRLIYKKTLSMEHYNIFDFFIKKGLITQNDLGCTLNSMILNLLKEKDKFSKRLKKIKKTSWKRTC